MLNCQKLACLNFGEFFVFILTQGVASGEVYTQLLAVYLFQNDM